MMLGICHLAMSAPCSRSQCSQYTLIRSTSEQDKVSMSDRLDRSDKLDIRPNSIFFKPR